MDIDQDVDRITGAGTGTGTGTGTVTGTGTGTGAGRSTRADAWGARPLLRRAREDWLLEDEDLPTAIAVCTIYTWGVFHFVGCD